MWGTGKISVCELQQENPIIKNPNKARIVQNFTHISDSLMYLRYKMSGFGGLEVSALASGTQVRRFKPGRSLRIFWAKKSSAHLPSEGK